MTRCSVCEEGEAELMAEWNGNKPMLYLECENCGSNYGDDFTTKANIALARLAEKDHDF